jgi:hypothetical protein
MYVTRVAIKMHNILERQDDNHRDAIYRRFRLFGYVPGLETIVPFHSEDIALYLHSG